MKHYLKRSVNLVLFLALALIFISCSPYSLHGDTEDVVKKSFNVKAGGTLSLDTDLGSIRVESEKGDTIHLEVIMKVGTSNESKAREIFDDFELKFDRDGKDLRIEGDYKRKNSLFSWATGKRLKVKFIITVPEKYNLDLRTRGGSIKISDIEGEVKAKTSGGSLTFDYVKGTLWGKTSGGSINLEGCSGNVEVNTSGGSIRIGKVAGEVKAHTSGGSIRVKEVMGTINASTSGGSVSAYISKQPTGDCKLTTSGGSVTARLAAGIKVNVYAKTSGGRVHCDLPVTIKGSMSKTKLQGKINGGGPELYLKTSGGSVRIKELD
jgi:DUF4097 and DUF4098 domain-containing protein YvlB